jgi:ABC-type multidrug transport system fused ATPase/permease subunit
MAALDRVNADGETVLVIAHSHSTLTSCDQVVRLANGRIVATGPPSELLDLDD